MDTLEFILRTAKVWRKLEPCVTNFFNEVVPEMYKCAAANRPSKYRDVININNIHHTTPRDLLVHPLFHCLRIPIDEHIAPLESYNTRSMMDEHAFMEMV